MNKLSSTTVSRDGHVWTRYTYDGLPIVTVRDDGSVILVEHHDRVTDNMVHAINAVAQRAELPFKVYLPGQFMYLRAFGRPQRHDFKDGRCTLLRAQPPNWSMPNCPF